MQSRRMGEGMGFFYVPLRTWILGNGFAPNEPYSFSPKKNTKDLSNELVKNWSVPIDDLIDHLSDCFCRPEQITAERLVIAKKDHLNEISAALKEFVGERAAADNQLGYLGNKVCVPVIWLVDKLPKIALAYRMSCVDDVERNFLKYIQKFPFQNLQSGYTTRSTFKKFIDPQF